jgi:hypothetical protein
VHKLKLESLQIESFVTAPEPQLRGTVRGNAAIDTGATGPLQPATTTGPVIATYNVRDCGETQYFDCTFGCSYNTRCIQLCYVQPIENSRACDFEVG